MDPEKVHARRWWVLFALCLSLVVIGMDNTILNVALPTLVRDLHASSSELQWIVDSYTIVYASLLLTAGSLGDRRGRKGALTLGLVIFAGGSLWAAFSGSAAVLIAARATMGIGGCLIMPSTLSILTNVFTEPRERAKAIGLWAGFSGIGIAAGPAMGGWLLSHFWWGSVFLINVPIAAVAILLGHFTIPTSRDPSAPRPDLPGTGLSVLGLTVLLYGIIEAPSAGWANGGVLAGFLGGVVVLTVFVLWERASDHPMLDVRFFKNPRFSGASFAITLVFFAMFGMIFLLTQYLQFVLGFSPARAGLGLIPLAVAMMIFAPLSAPLTARVGNKISVAGGLGIALASLVLLTQATVHSGYLLVGIVLGVAGIGLATASAPATDSIMGSLPRAKAGVGSAVNDTTRQVGGAMGVAILGSVTAASYHGGIARSSALAGLARAQRSSAHDSLGGALGIARGAGVLGTKLAADARQAYVHAMSAAVWVGVGVALVGVLVALVFLPARARVEGELGDEQTTDLGGAQAPDLATSAEPSARR